VSLKIRAPKSRNKLDLDKIDASNYTAFWLGIEEGYTRAAAHVLESGVATYKDGDQDTARTLREIALELDALATEARAKLLATLPNASGGIEGAGGVGGGVAGGADVAADVAAVTADSLGQQPLSFSCKTCDVPFAGGADGVREGDVCPGCGSGVLVWVG
jgi:hypothetical protein